MNRREMLAARVLQVASLNPQLRRVVLEPAHGGLFPTGAAGAHILLEMRHGAETWRNAYSLVSPPDQRTRYEIIVRRVPASRGGSAFVHEHLQAGDALAVGSPVNLFPMSKVARKHVMLAGGIGVTPFLSYLPVLAASGAPFDLRLCCRAEDGPAFASLLAPWPQARVHADNGLISLDVAGLLREQPIGAHLYLCGPPPFMDHVVRTAGMVGWPASRLHLEFFGGAAPGAPFRAVLARSGITIEVAPGRGLLDSIEAAGVDAPCLCRGGVCGECRLAVLDGKPEHRDHFLTDEQKASGAWIMPCVSRATSPELVLDI